jgi:hypothetical protein
MMNTDRFSQRQVYAATKPPTPPTRPYVTRASLSYLRRAKQRNKQYWAALPRISLPFLSFFSPNPSQKHFPSFSYSPDSPTPQNTMHHVSSSSSRALRRASAKAARAVLARGVHKEIKFSNEGRASILKGVDVLANAVSVTLGPKGLLLFLSQCGFCWSRMDLLTCRA